MFLALNSAREYVPKRYRTSSWSAQFVVFFDLYSAGVRAKTLWFAHEAARGAAGKPKIGAETSEYNWNSWAQQDLNLYFNIMNIKFYLLN